MLKYDIACSPLPHKRGAFQGGGTLQTYGSDYAASELGRKESISYVGQVGSFQV